jgi:hypothetical protein
MHPIHPRTPILLKSGYQVVFVVRDGIEGTLKNGVEL